MSPLQPILQALFPSTCASCGQVLVAGESQLCVSCLSDMPRTGYSDYDDNPAERMLLGRVRFEHATAMLHYNDGMARRTVHAMKFHRCPELCIEMGRLMALDIMRRGRFDDVDTLVPVPLHWRRRLGRGYNQSALLCRGIAEVMPHPIVDRSLIRHRYTEKQSLQSTADRLANVDDAFRVRQPNRLSGRHILLVDDVMTTGATLGACADALASVTNLKISVATLCIAG